MPDIFQFNSNKPIPATNQSGQNTGASTTASNPTQPSDPINPVAKTTAAQSIANLPQTAMNLFSTLSVKPRGVNFANQDPNEDVILFFRADFITNAFWIFATIFLLFVPIIFAILAPMVNLSLSMLNPQANLVILYFYYLLVFSYAFISFMYWFYNVGMVTNKHIIGVQFSDVTYKNISTTPLQEVADIDFTQQGFSQTFFDYGTVSIQTEGINPKIDLVKIPQPGKVTDIILQIREALNE